MMNSKRPYWFGKKKHGIGIGPVHPIGWIITIIVIALILIGAQLPVTSGAIITRYVIIVGTLIAYAIIIIATFNKDS